MEPRTPLLPESLPEPGGVPPRDPGHQDHYAHPDALYRRPDDTQRQSFFRRRVAPLGAAIIALLAKLKALLLFLGQFKLLVTAGSMLVSIAAYASIWGFQFALGFVVLLLVHELGHVIALKREGIKASLPMFIPFLGAVISARSLGDNAVAEARVGLAGPILGSLGSAACILVWHATGNDLWRALAFTGFFLNLFNLLPVLPLDGGRAMAAMAPGMWLLGFLAMIALAIVFPNPIILIIVVFAGLETYRRWQQRRTGSPEQRAYYRVRPRDRFLVAAVYLSLIALLVVGMNATHLPRTLG
ncbi:MAG: site-2 protease family protein [Actinomycetota bacterium]|nr:site-2 protease family protein [Actinomycetota bacterium]